MKMTVLQEALPGSASSLSLLASLNNTENARKKEENRNQENQLWR
jgi:hypothetical protein